MKLKWQQAPVKTQWGDEMVVASVAIDKDHTVCLYCERDQTSKVDSMFAQPAQQEPVAVHQYRSPHCSDWYDGVPDHHDGHGPYEVRTLYTSPPVQRTWVGLTDEEMDDCWNKLFGTGNYNRRNVYRAIEAKLKEKNNG